MSVADRSFGEELRALRELRQLTLTEFARHAHYSPGHVSKIERGMKLPSLDFAEKCDRELRAGGRLVDLAIVARQHDSQFTINAPAQLPAGTAAFVGRGERIARLDELLSAPVSVGSARVAVIDGGPGIGKTAVALRWAHQVAQRFPDGQMFVDLHGYDEAHQAITGDVLEGFLRDLGVPPSAIPGGEEARSRLFRSLLAEKQVLLVLDNAVSSDQVLPLLPTGSGCAVVVTSRQRLSGLSVGTGAVHVTLAPLNENESLELLARVGSRQRVEAEPEAAAEIVSHCARLPLALRIAAEYVAANLHLTLQGLAEQLSAEADRLDLLPTADAPSLRAVFSWSYRALSPTAARVFRLLGLSATPSISMSGIAALAGAPLAAVRGVVDRLRAAHLVELVEPDYVRLHDLLQAYGHELSHRHDAPDERAAAIERLLHWYLHSAASANDAVAPNRGQPDLPSLPADVEPLRFDSTEFDAALTWCEREAANLVAITEHAHRHKHHELAWLLAVVQFHYLYLAKPWHHWLRVTSIGLESARAINDIHAEAWCLHNLGVGYMEMRKFDEALENLKPALAIRDRIEDWWGLGWTTFAVGMVLYETGQHEDACHRLHQSSACFKHIDLGYGIAAARMLLGAVYTGMGTFGMARRELQAALNAFTTMQAADGQSYVWRKLAWLEHEAGNQDAALTAADSAQHACRARDDRRGVADTLHLRGRVLKDLGRIDDAHDALTEAFTIFDAALDARATEVRDELAELDGR